MKESLFMTVLLLSLTRVYIVKQERIPSRSTSAVSVSKA
jgi:hypothetical protein